MFIFYHIVLFWRLCLSMRLLFICTNKYSWLNRPSRNCRTLLLRYRLLIRILLLQGILNFFVKMLLGYQPIVICFSNWLHRKLTILLLCRKLTYQIFQIPTWKSLKNLNIKSYLLMLLKILLLQKVDLSKVV